MLKKLITKNWVLLFILLIASFCRLYRISDYMEFLGDQGRDVVIVRDFLKNGNFFFIGPQTSIGNMYLGPFYYYLIAPSLLLANYNPVGPSVFVALLGILTVFLIYKFSRQWFTSETGYIASFLYAISPVVIKYSNFSWNPNIMPIFSLLFIYFLLEKKYIFASIAFSLCLNSHYLGLLLLIPALFIWISQNRPHFNSKSTILAIGVFILSLLPQILFDIKHQGQNFNAITTFFSKRETTINLKAYKAIPKLPEIFNQVTTRLLTAKFETVGIFVSILFFILLIKLIIKNNLNKKSKFTFYSLLIWFFSGLVGLALYKQHIYDHYFGFIFPVIFILMALVVTNLNRYSKLLIILFLTILSIIENPFRYPPPSQLKTTIAITQSIIDQSSGQPFNFALLAKMNYDPGYLYQFYQEKSPYFNLRDRITEQLFVVCEPFQIECQPINHPEWGIAAFGWAKIDRQWEINGIQIFRLIHNPSGQK